MVQRIIGAVILVVGLIYGVILAKDCLRDRDALRAEKGRLAGSASSSSSYTCSAV